MYLTWNFIEIPCLDCVSSTENRKFMMCLAKLATWNWDNSSGRYPKEISTLRAYVSEWSLEGPFGKYMYMQTTPADKPFTIYCSLEKTSHSNPRRNHIHYCWATKLSSILQWHLIGETNFKVLGMLNVHVFNIGLFYIWAGLTRASLKE